MSKDDKEYIGRRMRPEFSDDPNFDSAFDIKRSRPEFVDQAYSTEIDGGDMSVITKKSPMRKILLAVLGALILTAGALVFLQMKTPDSDKNTDSIVEKPANALSSVFPDVEVNEDATSVQVADDLVSTSRGLAFTALVPIERVEKTCAVSKSSEFCLVGVAKYESKLGNIYYSNNLVGSRNFANMKEFSLISEGESVTTAFAIVDFAGDETHFHLFVDNASGAGFFIEVPESGNSKEQFTLVENRQSS